MKVAQRHCMAAWVVYGALFLTSSAQNGTNEIDISQCDSFNTLSPDAHVNSTGSISFTWEDGDKDWHLTTTFNDTRDPVLIEGIQDFGTWVSVPGDTDTSICTYALRPINATGTGDNGCEGVLSQQCVSWMTNNIKYGTRNDGSEKKCARSPYHDDVAKNCGDGVVFVSQIGRFHDLSNDTCTISSPPGNDMPDGYRTHEVFGMGPARTKADRFVDDFDFYDLYVRQTRPWVITTPFQVTTRTGSRRQTTVLCQAPDRVLGSSRQPEGPWPPQNAGSHVVSCKAGLSFLVASIVVWTLGT